MLLHHLNTGPLEWILVLCLGARGGIAIFSFFFRFDELLMFIFYFFLFFLGFLPIIGLRFSYDAGA